MSKTQHYRDLMAWQLAMSLAKEMYSATELLPKTEGELRTELRRSAITLASQIAGSQGRLTDAETRSALGAARGTLNELETQLELAVRLGLLATLHSEHLLDQATEVAQQMNGLIAALGA